MSTYKLEVAVREIYNHGMNKETASNLQVDFLQKASSKFYLREDDYGDVVEDTKIIRVEHNPSVIKLDYVEIMFGLSPVDNTVMVVARSTKNILFEKGAKRHRDFLEKDKDLLASVDSLPLRIIDQATRDQIVVTAPANNRIGAELLDPLPALSAQVELVAPPAQHRLSPNPTKRNPGEKTNWRENLTDIKQDRKLSTH